MSFRKLLMLIELVVEILTDCHFVSGPQKYGHRFVFFVFLSGLVVAICDFFRILAAILNLCYF